MKMVSLGGAVWFCIAGVVSAQPAAPQVFEVASVKPSPPDVPGMFTRYLPGGGIRFTGVTLKNLIAIAYGGRAFQILGGSAWVDTDRFDIEARSEPAETTVPIDPVKGAEYQRKANERLKTLLADRFQLALRPETREQPIYILVVAKDGPKFRESTQTRSLIRAGRGTVKGQASTTAMLALNLSNELRRR